MEKNIKPTNNNDGGTLVSYVTGFVLSILFTLGAYFIVQVHINSGHAIISHKALLFLILGFAVIQLVVQLWFFLHLGSESGSRWKLGVFLSTISLVLIIVIGSIWIMNHLNYNMTPAQVDQYMQVQQGGF